MTSRPDSSRLSFRKPALIGFVGGAVGGAVLGISLGIVPMLFRPNPGQVLVVLLPVIAIGGFVGSIVGLGAGAGAGLATVLTPGRSAVTVAVGGTLATLGAIPGATIAAALLHDNWVIPVATCAFAGVVMAVVIALLGGARR